MHEGRRNFLVGLFILFGLVAFGVLIVMFGQSPTWFSARTQYVLNIQFDSASGIRAGTLVTVSGIEVGRVRSVDFKDANRFDEGVVVVVSFDPGYQFRQGTYAVTTEPGFGMGRPPISLVIPATRDGPMLASGATIRGQVAPAVDSLFPPGVRSNLEKTVTLIGDAAKALTPVLDDMHLILQPRDVADVDRPGGPPGNIASASVRLDAALKHFNQVLGDPNVKSELKQTVSNVYKISEDGVKLAGDLKTLTDEAGGVAKDIKAFVGEARGTLANVDDKLERIARSVLTNLESVARLLDELNMIGKRANAGEGTLGKIVTDDRLYEAMVLTFKRLSETVEETKLLIKEWQKGKVKVTF